MITLKDQPKHISQKCEIKSCYINFQEQVMNFENYVMGKISVNRVEVLDFRTKQLWLLGYSVRII